MKQTSAEQPRKNNGTILCIKAYSLSWVSFLAFITVLICSSTIDYFCRNLYMMLVTGLPALGTLFFTIHLIAFISIQASGKSLLTPDQKGLFLVTDIFFSMVLLFIGSWLLDPNPFPINF